MPEAETASKPVHSTEVKKLWRARRIVIYEEKPQLRARMLEISSATKRWGPSPVHVTELQIGSCSEKELEKFKDYDRDRAKKTYAKDKERQEKLLKQLGPLKVN